MNNIDWLLEHADLPIRYNLLRLTNYSRTAEVEDSLLEHPDVQYWMQYPRKCQEEQSVGQIHGGDDFRYEQYMTRLTNLGMHSGIKPFHACMSVYLEYLHRQIDRPREERLSFGKIYSYHDQEQIIATYLAQADYTDDPAVQHVVDKRIRLLHKFTRQKRYDIYVDGSKYPGVPKQWQPYLIDPGLYHDGQIRLPTVHDFILLSAAYRTLHPSLQANVDTIVDWIFAEQYGRLHYRYGYFYAPGGSYSTKAVCRELSLPSLSNGAPKGLLQVLLILSHFPSAARQQWYQNALSYLEVFKNEHRRYTFPRPFLPGMGENNRKRLSAEIESTYWMERIHSMV
jgi:hypothetical protein